ncbi:MAG: hypothetical protein HY433_03035 [Candidatus Liptonbacteria bacterium]|nr:hypothetical protein [Candidatus Liptonbacteria bacterium]
MAFAGMRADTFSLSARCPYAYILLLLGARSQGIIDSAYDTIPRVFILRFTQDDSERSRSSQRIVARAAFRTFVVNADGNRNFAYLNKGGKRFFSCLREDLQPWEPYWIRIGLGIDFGQSDRIAVSAPLHGS